MSRRLICEHVNPPIPDRSFDYCAYYVPNDMGEPQGYGETQLLAIEDLIEKLQADAYAEGRKDEREEQSKEHV